MICARADTAQSIDEPEVAIDDEQRHQERDAGQDANHQKQKAERPLTISCHRIGRR